MAMCSVGKWEKIFRLPREISVPKKEFFLNIIYWLSLLSSLVIQTFLLA